VKHWLILIFLHTTSRKKLDVNKCNFTHFTLILLLRYLVECGTHGLAIYNNEFIFGSACIGYFETWCIQMCFICYCNNCISKEQYFELLFLCQTVWHPVAFEKHVFSCIDLTCVQWCRQVGRGERASPQSQFMLKINIGHSGKELHFFPPDCCIASDLISTGALLQTPLERQAKPPIQVFGTLCHCMHAVFGYSGRFGYVCLSGRPSPH